MSKLLATSPTLMPLQALEALEQFASAGCLSVVVGKMGLAERVVNVL